MALVSDFSHSEKVVLLKTLLTDFVRGKSLLVEPSQRHLATCIIRSLLLHHHVRSLLLSIVLGVIFSIPSVARTVPFFQTWSE